MYIVNVTSPASILYKRYRVHESWYLVDVVPLLTAFPAIRLSACGGRLHYAHANVGNPPCVDAPICRSCRGVRGSRRWGLSGLRWLWRSVSLHIYSHGSCGNFSDVPPDDFGCAEGWSRAHCCFAWLINDSLCSQSFCAAFALSAALNDSWW
jgi:hypothetical protein